MWLTYLSIGSDGSKATLEAIEPPQAADMAIRIDEEHAARGTIATMAPGTRDPPIIVDSSGDRERQ